MIAALNTTERGPKTTKAKKSAAKPTTLAAWKARANAKADAAYHEALTITASFPALQAHIEAWLPLRRAEADLDAVHSDLDAYGDEADALAAEQLWHDAMEVTRAAAKRLLDAPTSKPAEIVAKVAAFFAISDSPSLDAQDGEGGPNVVIEALLRDLAQQASLADERNRELRIRTHEWNEARDATFAAFGKHEATQADDDFDALCMAQERWESLTPPSLEALAEVMGYAMTNFGPLGYAFHSADCPRSVRDLLDGGDAAEVFAGRYYLHVLRMAGKESPALMTPPISNLYPAFKVLDVPDGEDLATAWERHHRSANPYPSRDDEYGQWRGPAVESVVEDKGAMQAMWHYHGALHRYARKLISEYEALGGRFTFHRDGDDEWFGTLFPRDGSQRAGEIERITANHEALRKVIAHEIGKREQSQ